MPARILGVDLSLRHAGFVVVDERGEVAWWDFVTSTKGAAQRAGKGVLLDLPKRDDRHQHQLERLEWWRGHLYRVLAYTRPTHIVLEGYAFASTGSGAIDMHELGGRARPILAGAAPLRIHDPATIKLATTGRGDATGAEVADAVREAIPWASSANPPAKKGGGQSHVPEEDLAAAFAMAELGRIELELRAARLQLEQLDPHRRGVFLRVTKGNPVNVLARPWLRLGDGARS